MLKLMIVSETASEASSLVRMYVFFLFVKILNVVVPLVVLYATQSRMPQLTVQSQLSLNNELVQILLLQIIEDKSNIGSRGSRFDN